MEPDWEDEDVCNLFMFYGILTCYANCNLLFMYYGILTCQWFF